MDQDSIVNALLDFIASDDASDALFNDVALQNFEYQFKNNLPFRKFAQKRGNTLRTVKNWSDIPAVPINAFKTLDLSCAPLSKAKAVFMTSGTSLGNVRGKSYHPVLDVYDASMRRNFQNRFMGNLERVQMGVLFPPPALMPNSSLAHYLNLAVGDFGLRNSRFFVGARGIEFSDLFDDLARAEKSGEPYALLGASFSFVHVIDEMA
ncbi:MAG: long-chain fatty acid--CoA ligase, partial [Pseudomonadota bacterium]|nr:long-chain fatty acid--CoA ligase [Pseudomonadota bacterium]